MRVPVSRLRPSSTCQVQERRVPLPKNNRICGRHRLWFGASLVCSFGGDCPARDGRFRFSRWLSFGRSTLCASQFPALPGHDSFVDRILAFKRRSALSTTAAVPGVRQTRGRSCAKTWSRGGLVLPGYVFLTTTLTPHSHS